MAKRDGGIGALSRWPDQLGGMERLQRIDGIDRLGLDVPFEHPEHDLVRRKVGEREAMLLDRFHLLVKINHG
jgi:hypothetical protein